MIEFQNIHKSFRDASGREAVALDGMNLVLQAGEIHCLIGPSGCGKTTSLRLVNRLEAPSQGCVRVNGEDIAQADVYALRRSIGYVIQSGGLFPHMTVAQNVGLLCELEGWSEARIHERTQELLELANLEASRFADRYPRELSGGEQQRVGLARALALDPDIILMDEPFAALDPITKAQVHQDFAQLLSKVRKTVLLVTHDLHEAFKLADRVSLMNVGKIAQSGTLQEFRKSPADGFVEAFLAAQDFAPEVKP